MSERGYASPAAFRRAATDRLRAAAKDSRWGLHELQRQLSYDRLLARLYAGGGPWIVKGATALIARGIAVRSTIDIDLYRERSTGEAEQELREACGHDLADWFSFRLGAGQPVNDGAGLRIPVDAYLGETAWSRFHIDLVGSDMRMTGEPEAVPPIAGVDMPQLGRHPYLAYPLIDHIADKICAILERYGALEAPSTRYKDLVDLVAILTTSSVVAAGQAEALRHEAGRRGLGLPQQFDVPDRGLWARGYGAEARRSALSVGRDLDGALAVVCPFVDPVLQHRAGGSWEPWTRSWSELR